MMKHAISLGQWLQENGVALQAFGDLFGVSHTTVSRWVRGTSEPEPHLIPMIVNATGGQVSPLSLAPKARAAAECYARAMSKHEQYQRREQSRAA